MKAAAGDCLGSGVAVDESVDRAAKRKGERTEEVLGVARPRQVHDEAVSRVHRRRLRADHTIDPFVSIHQRLRGTGLVRKQGDEGEYEKQGETASTTGKGAGAAAGD